MKDPGTDPSPPGPVAPSGDAFLANVLEFGRALRAVGIPTTPLQMSELIRALGWVGVADREEVFRVARALLVTRREDLQLFETVFRRFWRAPGDGPAARPQHRPRAPRDRPVRKDRPTIATLMAFKAYAAMEELDVGDRSGTFSDEEILRRKHFADMTHEELEAVRRLLDRFEWPSSLRVTRRRVPDRSGPEIDLRRILRSTSHMGSLPARLPRRRRAVKPRPVIFLADVSGSMEKYSRLILQFFHAASRSMPYVETFVFGTRLTRITAPLRLRNVDRALDEASAEVVDWAGGTRIGACVGEFNRRWSRRVLRRGAVVVVVSDGCDLGDHEAVTREVGYLQRRCHRLIWMNPYVGRDGYAPRVAGMAAALPFVDDFLSMKNVQALEAFSEALARIPPSGRSTRRFGRTGSWRETGTESTSGASDGE